MQKPILEQKKNPTKAETKHFFNKKKCESELNMIKELAIGLGYIIIITIIVYPFSVALSDIMIIIMAPGVLTTILVSIVKYFGFFIGIGTINWVYKGLNLQQQSQYGGF